MRGACVSDGVQQSCDTERVVHFAGNVLLIAALYSHASSRQLLKPHEALLSDAVGGGRRSRGVTSVTSGALSASGSLRALSQSHVTQAARRRAVLHAAARASGPGSGGGGGGARAKGSCMFVGSQRRGPTTLAPRASMEVQLMACLNGRGVHNVNRMRLMVDEQVVPPDAQCLVVVDSA